MAGTPGISVEGPSINGTVGHLRVCADFGDRVVEFSPAFEVVGIANHVRSRQVSRTICEETAQAFVKAKVDIGTILLVLGEVNRVASPERLRVLEEAA